MKFAGDIRNCGCIPGLKIYSNSFGASVDGGIPGLNPSNSDALNSNQVAIECISQAQSALQNSGTVGRHDIWTPATN
jgi:hypothetical protein